MRAMIGLSGSIGAQSTARLRVRMAAAERSSRRRGAPASSASSAACAAAGLTARCKGFGALGLGMPGSKPGVRACGA